MPWGYGIGVSYNEHNVLSQNTCTWSNYMNIYLLQVENTTLSSNLCTDSIYGMNIEQSKNLTVSNNTCNNNAFYGILLSGSESCSIVNNICSKNKYDGIRLLESDNNGIMGNTVSNNKHGIGLSSSSWNTISYNTCSSNRAGDYSAGISISSSGNNTLSRNTCQSNKIGVLLSSSSGNNTAHYNNIYGNSRHGVNASDNGGRPVNASYNWWGDASGPHHTEKNAEGKGDDITDHVLFEPWLQETVSFQPQAIINSISPDQAIAGAAVRLSGSGIPSDEILRFKWRSSQDGVLYHGESAEFECSNLSVGVHTIFLKVLDEEGVWSEEVSQSLEIVSGENHPPTVALLSPMDNVSLSSTTVTLSWNGDDHDGDVLHYDVYLDTNLDPDTKRSSQQTGESYEVTGLTDGETYFWKIIVNDGSGTVSSGIRSFTVDFSAPNQPPAITITSPANNSVVTGIVSIAGTASDSDGSIEKIESLMIYNDVETIWETVTGTTSWTYQWNSTEFPGGSYRFRFRAFDGLDYSETVELTLKVQNDSSNILPTVSVFPPTGEGKVSGIVLIKGSASDQDGTIQRVEISIGGGDWVNVTGTDSWSYQWDTSKAENGEYLIRIRAYDGKNYSSVVSLNFNVNNDAPSSESDDTGFLPGFETIVVSAGIIVVAIGKGKRKQHLN